MGFGHGMWGFFFMWVFVGYGWVWVWVAGVLVSGWVGWMGFGLLTAMRGGD